MVIPHSHSEPLDALLASYCSGVLSRPLHAVVASHLALSPKSRPFVSALENALGEEMEKAPASAPMVDRERRLAAIFDVAPMTIGKPDAASDFMPAPLAAYIGESYDDLRWRSVLPGLREVVFEKKNGCKASLLWIKAGRAMPSHTHEGLEATLVLRGSFSDSTGYFGRGDLAVADSELDHKPVAGADEDCICFAVSEGSMHLTGPIARYFSWAQRR
jgi:putative transcriptional regulator